MHDATTAATGAPRPLRVLFCLLYYLPHRTGLTVYVQLLAERLAARGHRVTVLCAHHDRRTPHGEALEGGVRVVRLRPLPLAISRGMLMPAYPLALRRLLRRHDVVVVNTPLLETALIGRLARTARVPLLNIHHGDLILPGGRINSLIRGTMLALYRDMARRAAALVSHSRDYAEQSYYLAPFLDKLEIIHPPVAIPPPDAARVRARRALWAPTGGPLIAYAGRFVEEKRPDLLLRALDVVLPRFPQTRVVFAGQHVIPYEDTWRRHRELVERHRDRLLFLGVLPDSQQMADFYAACDVLAMPSDTECFALVQVEAMLCGTPVVMTDTPGGRVPVETTGMGRLVPRGDWRAIGEALVEVLGDRSRYVKPAAEIERHFSVDDTVDRYVALLRRMVDAGVGSSGMNVPPSIEPSFTR